MNELNSDFPIKKFKPFLIIVSVGSWNAKIKKLY